MMEKTYLPIIGLEIHVELKTKSKMFCQDSADYFGKPPNTLTCPVCLGMPGALPTPNKKAIEWTILIGQALKCQINRLSKFDRKHYFYPDLPKGYQISQYDQPIAIKGYFNLNGKKIRIKRVHLEEDTAKLIHDGKNTLIDFNRAGVPLVEIVTEPDFNSSDDVKKFLEELQVIIRYLDVSDADMEKGSMRLEPNISIKTKAEELPKYKVEVKNINSFRFVKQAIDFEIKRQTEILKENKIPNQETRGFDEKKGKTYPQRKKEEAHDYRYFPEPDIPPLVFFDEYLKKIEKMMPELPEDKIKKYVEELGLKYQDAYIITRNKNLSAYFEEVYAKYFEKTKKLEEKVKNVGQSLANLIINRKVETNLPVEDFISKAIEILSPKKTDIKAVDRAVEKVILANSKAVADYKSGKINALMFLIGQVMREMKGKAEAKIVGERISLVLGRR